MSAKLPEAEMPISIEKFYAQPFATDLARNR